MVSRLKTSICVATLLSVGACAPNGRAPLLLDALCDPQDDYGETPVKCSVGGDATLVSGIGFGLAAVRFGPSGTGELRLPLSRITAAGQPTWSFEVLATSRRSEGSELFRSITWGSCGAECPEDPPDISVKLLEDNFQWVEVVTNGIGAETIVGGPGFGTIPDSAAIVFRGADIDMIEVNMPGYDGYLYNY